MTGNNVIEKTFKPFRVLLSCTLGAVATVASASMKVLINLLMCLVAPAAISAYSFPSCVNYDTAGVCWGFIRYYSSILPTASHAYNFQKNAYNFTDTTRLANNAASQQDLAIDPTLQNRTAAAVPAVPNSQQVFAAYGAYPLLTAAPGQNITMTWPRTADPDGTPADGSSTVNIYYSLNTSMNAGDAFNSSKDPTLSTFMQNPVAKLAFLGDNNCTVKDDKYDLASHCRATFALPGNLTAGSIYTFLWRWVILNNGPQPVDGTPLVLVYNYAFEVAVSSALAVAAA